MRQDEATASSWFWPFFCLFVFEETSADWKGLKPGARFSKVPIINGPGKLSPFTLKTEVSIVLHLMMIKLWVNETKWSTLLARTCALILYISIWIFDFGHEKLAGLSRNGPLEQASTVYSKASLVFSSFHRRRTQQIMASGVVAMNILLVTI